MSSPNANTFDLVPPRRPGTADFNGIAKTDDAAYPPNPQTHPNAAEWNTVEFLTVAMGRLIPFLVISVTGGVTPTLFGFLSPASAVVSGSFTFNRTGAGVVEVTWPTGTFPPVTTRPELTINGAADARGVVEPIANGFRVRTFDAAGAAADESFTAVVR